MQRAALILGLLTCAACGGGGGGGTPAGTPARLTAADVEFGPTASSADLVVALANLPASAPALLQLTIELPPALTATAATALQAIQPVPTLRGELAGPLLRVVCGDDQSPEGSPLSNGPLFRLRLEAAIPRQVGPHELVLRAVIAANADGSQAVFDELPTIVTVTLR